MTADDIVIWTGNLELDSKIQEWVKWDQNEATKKEILKLVWENNTKKLNDVLLSRLTFGTAGLRGVMAGGYNRMNDLVIIQTTQGLVQYVLSTEPEVKEKGIVIGFDGRHNSHRFAQLTAAAILSRGIPVYLYSRMVPTPFVPFGVLQFGATMGIMVTASHNPKDDNGYKVYRSNGAQIKTPHDKGIQTSIEQNLEPWAGSWEYEKVAGNPLCRDPLPEIMDKYFGVIRDHSMFRTSLNPASKIRFTYTPMHGVAHLYMKEVFKACALPDFIPVKEQMEPDPDFTTVKFPNPEEGKSALDLSFKTANEHGSTIILANDPDADRLAIAEKQPNGEWKVFNGNETGGLIGWWLWYCDRQKNPDRPAKDAYMIASTVSSKILRAIANKEGFNFIETLTGFKWMGNKSDELVKEGKTVLFAFEEAIGFMCGTTVLDKDGLIAAAKLAEMAVYLESKGLTITQQLHNIYKTYGYHVCKNSYWICYDQATIKSMFTRLRNFTGPNTYPSSCGGYAIENVRDLTTGYDSSRADKKATLPASSSSEMITFSFANGCIATLRTSGTEPKIKYYTEFCARPEQQDWEELELELDKMVACIVEEFMQPGINKLIERST